MLPVISLAKKQEGGTCLPLEPDLREPPPSGRPGSHTGSGSFSKQAIYRNNVVRPKNTQYKAHRPHTAGIPAVKRISATGF